MDYPSEAYEAVFPSLLRFYQSKSLVDDESASKELVFNPEAVIARCFKQFKQEDFHPPQSPRRIIILPRKEALVPVNPTPQPQAPPEPTPSSKALEAGDIQEQPEDPRAWLTQRLRVRQDLESPGNIERWLQNKSRLTPSEAKVLHESHKEHEAQLMGQLATTRDTKKKSLRPLHRQVPQLQLPKPSALSALYSYLCSHKIKIQEIFHKVEQGKNQRISREEFITALKVVGVPLKSQEVEDIVIYLSSLGKHNSITVDNLASICKQWSLAQQKSTLATAKENYRSAKDSGSPQSPSEKQQVNLAPEPLRMDLLTVPVVNTEMELPIPSIQYTEQCRLVHSGNKHFDERCLPSTSHGEMQAVPNRHLSGLPAVLEALQILQPPADRGHPRESPDVPGGQDHFPEGPGASNPATGRLLLGPEDHQSEPGPAPIPGRFQPCGSEAWQAECRPPPPLPALLPHCCPFAGGLGVTLCQCLCPNLACPTQLINMDWPCVPGHMSLQPPCLVPTQPPS